MTEGQFLIIKLYDHKGTFQAYDIGRDTHSIIALGCRNQEGIHKEYNLYPVHKVEDWARSHGFKVVIEKRTIQFNTELAFNSE